MDRASVWPLSLLLALLTILFARLFRRLQRMKMSLKQMDRLLGLMMKHSEHSFGRHVSSGLAIREIRGKSEAIFSYPVPESLCVSTTTGKSDSVFSTSAILAVFDQVSTYGFMVLDHKSRRPGVSVHLSCEVLQPTAKSGDVVDIVTRIDKLGKNLGFATVEMVDAKGQVLAVGKHIKFLPMGSIWNVLFSPMILPVTMMVFETFILKKSKASYNKQSAASVHSGLGLQLVSNTSDSSSRDKLASQECTMTVGKEHQNPLGVMHGGALTMGIEESLRLLAEDEPGDGKGQYKAMKSMEVRYLSGMKSHIRIQTSSRSGRGSGGPCDGNVLDKKGNVCAQFTCRY